MGIPGGLVRHRLLDPVPEILNQWGLRFAFLTASWVMDVDAGGLRTTPSTPDIADWNKSRSLGEFPSP